MLDHSRDLRLRGTCSLYLKFCVIEGVRSLEQRCFEGEMLAIIVI